MPYVKFPTYIKDTWDGRNSCLFYAGYAEQEGARDTDVQILRTLPRGSFKNHVDMISHFFDHPPTLVDIFNY